MENQTLTRKHIDWIDVAKGIGIFLILFGHVSYELKTRYIHTIIYTFHIPAFFVLSGLVFSIKPGTKFLSFVKNKVFRIGIPSLIFVTIGLIVALCVKRPINAVSLVKYFFYFDGTYFWTMPCWFFFSLFFVYLIAFAIKLPEQKWWVKALMGVVFFVLGFLLYLAKDGLGAATNPFSKFGIDKTIIVTGFFIVGSLIRDLHNKWSLDDKKHQLYLIPTLVVFMGLTFVFGVLLNSRVSLYQMKLHNYWSFVASSIFGTCSLIIVSIFISNVKWMTVLPKMWGKHTILIAGTHYIYRCSRTLFIVMTQGMGLYKTYWGDLIMLVYVIALLMLYIPIGYLVDKYLPYMSGANPTFYQELRRKRLEKSQNN